MLNQAAIDAQQQRQARPAQKPHSSGSHPHIYGRWNYQDRRNDTMYNSAFQGHQNRKYQDSIAVNNQGYQNIQMTFPHTTMASCRYATGLKANRPLQMNNWHSRKHEWDVSVGIQALERTGPPPEVKVQPKSNVYVAPASLKAVPTYHTGNTHYKSSLQPAEIYRPSKRGFHTRGTNQYYSERVRGWKNGEGDALENYLSATSRPTSS